MRGKKLLNSFFALCRILNAAGPSLAQAAAQPTANNFASGVLAVNTDQAYYQPGQNVWAQIGSLDDTGHTLCNSNLELDVLAPNGGQQTFTPKQNSSCGDDNVTNNPDYSVNFPAGAAIGQYQLILKNLDTGLEVNNFFNVQASVPFTVTRQTATRINPFKSTYQVNLTVKANEAFNGRLEEYAQPDFVLSNFGGAGLDTAPISTGQTDQRLSWQMSLRAGESETVSYTYQAPLSSPDFFQIGFAQLRLKTLPQLLNNLPADGTGQIVYLETHPWEIASDITSMFLQVTGNWSVASNWSNGVPSTTADTALISGTSTVTDDINVTLGTLTFLATSTKVSLSVNSGITLTVNGTTTLTSSTTASSGVTLSGVGTLTTANMQIGTTVAAGTIVATSTATSSITALNVTGNFTASSSSASAANQISAVFVLSSGTATFSGGVNLIKATNAATILTMASGATQTGTLILAKGGTIFSGTGTLTANGTSATVIYSGAAPAMSVVTYRNLQLTGSGTYTGNIAAVSGNLTATGTAAYTTGAGLTVGGTLTVGTSSSFTVAGFTIGVTGTTTVAGVLGISSATAVKTFASIVVNSGGLMKFTGAGAITMNGLLEEDGTASTTGTTGAWIFQESDGNGVIKGTTSYLITLASATFSTNYTVNIPLTFTSTVAVTAATLTDASTLTVGTVLSGTGTTTTASNATLQLGGTPTGALSVDATGSTVVYTTTANMKVSLAHYYNLTIASGANTVTAVADTVDNNLTITSGIFTIGNVVFTASGSTTTVAGTLTISNASGTSNFKNILVQSGGLINSSAAGTVNAYGWLELDGTASTTGTTGIWTFQEADGNGAIKGTSNNISLTTATFTKAYSVNASTTITGAVTVTAATLTNTSLLNIGGLLSGTGTTTNASNATLTFTGASQPTGALYVDATGNTVVYAHTTTMGTSINHYYNLTASVGTLSAVADTVDNLLTINSGATFSIGNVAFTDSATTSVSGTLQIAGTTAASQSVFKQIVVNSGGTINTSGAGLAGVGVAVNGSLEVDGTGSVSVTALGTWTFQESDGNGQIRGTSSSTLLTATFANNYAINATTTVNGTMTVNGGATVTNASILTVGNALSGSGTTTQASGAVLNIGGTSGIGGLVASLNPNTVNYATSVNQTVKAVPYYNLTLSGSNVKTLTNVNTINNNFTVSGSVSATTSAATTIGGNLYLSTTGGLEMGNAAFTVDGIATISSGSLLLIKGNSTTTFVGALEVDGTMSGAGTGEVIANQNVFGSGAVNLTANEFLQRVTANQNFGQSGGSNTWTFENLNFENNNTANHVITVASGSTATITVSSLLTIGKSSDSFSTTFDDNTNDHPLNITGSTTITSQGVLQAPSSMPFDISGNFANSGGVFNANGGTVTFNGSATSTITAAATTTFYSIYAAKPSNLAFGHYTGANLFNIAGTFTATGTSGNLLTIASDLSGSQWMVNFSGTQSGVSYAYIRDGGCLAGSAIANTANSTNGGNNGSCWGYAALITISGTIYNTNASDTLSSFSGTVDLAVASTTQYAISAASGLFTFSSVVQPATGTDFTIWLNTGGTTAGSLVFRYGNNCSSNGNCTGLTMVKNSVVIDNKDVANGNMSIADMAGCTNTKGSACTDTDIGFIATSSPSASTTLTFATSTLYIMPGITFAPGGTVTAGSLNVVGTFTGASNATFTGGNVTGSGNINMTGGTFEVDGTGNFSGSSTPWVFNNLNIGNNTAASTTFIAAATTTVNSTLTVGSTSSFNAGASNFVLTATGTPFVVNSGGTFTASTSNFSYQAISGTTTVPSVAYYNLNISPSSGSPYFLLGSGTAGRATVARVASQNTGLSNFAASITQPFPGNVTAGNTIIIEAAAYAGSGSISVSKSSGTASLGTLSADKVYTNGSIELDIWHALVTVSGTLTMGASKSGATNMFIAENEYTNIAASPVDGTPDSNTGTSATESTNALSPSGSGVIVQLSDELSTANFFYTQSDNNIFNDPYGSTDFTGQAQDKIVSGSGPYTLTAGTGNSWPWYSVAVVYKATTSNSTVSSPISAANNLTISGPAIVDAYSSNTPVSIGGNITIGSNATFLAPSSSAFSISGSFANSGTFTHKNGTVIFNTSAGTATVNTGNSSFYNMIMSGSGTLTSQSTTSVAGALNISSGTFNGGTSTIILTGTGTPFNLAGSTNFSASTSRVSFQGTSGTTTIANAPYYNLDVSPSSGNPHFIFGVGTTTASSNYTTSFPLTENPISESGNWINGGATGLDWYNVQTASGHVYGTQPGTQGPCNPPGNLAGCDDSTAVLTGTWGSNQMAQATVYVSGTTYDYAEVELRLNTSISAHSLTGYEFTCSTVASNPYMQIVRWDGALASFTLIASAVAYCANGDTITAMASGSNLLFYKDGSLETSVPDSTYSGGSPGIGFYRQDSGGTNVDANYGFSSFTASSTNSLGIVATSTIANNFAISGPATVNAYASNTPVTVSGNITIGSSATYLAATSSTLTISGNFTNSGTFTHNNGTVVFASTTTSIITGPVTFYNLTTVTPGKTLQFHAGSITTIANVFTVTGQDGAGSNFVTIESDSPGTQWLAHFNTASSSIQFAYIQDSGCDAGSSIARMTGTDIDSGDNNYGCWIFITPLQDKSLSSNPTGGSGGGVQESGGGAGGGGSGTITLLAHTSTYTTSGAINTTGATLIVAIVVSSGGLTVAPNDNSSNTYASTSQYGVSGNSLTQIWYVCTPTIGASQTFTNNAGANSVLLISAWSGTGCLDTKNGSGNSTGVTSMQPGSITPSVSGELLVSGGINSGAATNLLSIDSGFSILDEPTTSGPASGDAYFIDSGVSAINPTWSSGSSNAMGAIIGAFGVQGNGSGGAGGGDGGGSQQGGGGAGGGGGGGSP